MFDVDETSSNIKNAWSLNYKRKMNEIWMWCALWASKHSIQHPQKYNTIDMM